MNFDVEYDLSPPPPNMVDYIIDKLMIGSVAEISGKFRELSTFLHF